MPPFLPRKRLRSLSPQAGSSRPGKGKGRPLATPPRKPTLFDDLDAGTGPKRSAEHSKDLLKKLATSDDQESSSACSEDEFEDVPAPKRQKANDASDDDEDIEFEDIQTHAAAETSAPLPSGDLELTLRKDTRVSLTNPLGTKKGPSKIERGIRVATHQMHVQMLMWHNAIRNSWLCDRELHHILLKQLPHGVQKEVERWRRDIGIISKKEEVPKAKGKGKGKEENSKRKEPDARNQRDWGEPAERLNAGLFNRSNGDPLIRLLKVLINYWRQRFRITCPGLRKLGYMSLERLDAEMKSYNNDDHEPELHGERIRDIAEFRERAKALDGSRDVGAQLFTALLRGLNIEARMIANLQPLGFGWSQNEEASKRNPRRLKKQAEIVDDSSSVDEDEDSDGETTVATDPQILEKFEPRGAKAEKAKQVTSYIIDLTALKPAKPERKEVEEGKETLQYFKTSQDYVLERHLKREEAILPMAKHVKMFTVKGKGNTSVEEKVFLRKDVVNCKTIETWHKEGRVPIEGEEPLKRVPYRAATINRRRELADAEQATGEKVLQGLYSWDQTEWIIPPPIRNGIIPKNNFGNIDLYVDSMLPKGAVHIPRRGTVKICKKLGIDYAEAVTGFEFGYRMAVPVITGVVVAEEYLDAVMEEWEKDEAERVRKEDEKRQKAAIGMWRKMLMGLRIVERVREEYGADVGDDVDAFNPWTNKNKGKTVDRDVEAQRRIMEQRDEDLAGGFLPEGHDEEELDVHHTPGFFPVAHEDDDGSDGGFVVEGHDERVKPNIGFPTPQSLQSNAKVGSVLDTDKEEDMEDAQTRSQDIKRHSRVLGSANKPTTAKRQASRTESKTPANRSAKTKQRISSSNAGKIRRQIILDSELDDDETSSLSDLMSVSEDAGSDTDEVSKKPIKRIAKRGSTSADTPETLRKTPRRNAARKSIDALKSHYFAHNDEDDDEE
ncbi:hypothetical protein OIDMADRAFT_104333 [Oidiodendron maius Zn]|uniref:Rad4 beta-hairpin domain-containing protein n=1 Tax=Oidiodendron maius (strain Zn) TaxID=913774 RepID=A0A0C3HB12_OIDMZ|nr:hypothetical protein OIDMADRAFT_104333 [Oidiodendron maius Zn]